MTKKRTNLQPWLDYFKMLQQYEQKGFLQMNPKEHEAYVTRAALLTLAGIDAEDVQYAAVSPQPEALTATISHLRAYAAYRWAPADPSAISHQPSYIEKPSYISAPFAVHIVKEDYPHDLLLTLLLQQKRSWRTAWRTVDTIETIDYTEQKPQEK